MPLSSTATSHANVLDSMTTEGAPELTEHLEGGALKCYACGHRCLIKPDKRGICKVRFNEGGHLRVPVNYVAAAHSFWASSSWTALIRPSISGFATNAAAPA